MAFGASLTKILGAVGKYSAVAAQAVQEAEAQVGPGNGATKKQIALAYVLAAAHAGEDVDVRTVGQIATTIDLAVNIANMFGAFGAPKTSPIAVPAAAAEAKAP